MSIRRVFLICRHPLLHASIRLLLSHPEIAWVGTATDPEAAREQIASSRPDTILIEGREGTVASDALGILQTCSWQVRVIGLSLTDNKISVYDREEHILGHAEDLPGIVLAQ